MLNFFIASCPSLNLSHLFFLAVLHFLTLFFSLSLFSLFISLPFVSVFFPFFLPFFRAFCSFLSFFYFSLFFASTIFFIINFFLSFLSPSCFYQFCFSSPRFFYHPFSFFLSVLLSDESFSSFHPETPLPLSLLQERPVYLQVVLAEPQDPDLVLLVLSCIAYTHSHWMSVYERCVEFQRS